MSYHSPALAAPTIESVIATHAALRANTPLVQCLTNVVSANFMANVLLSAGAAPAMVDNPEEAADFARIAGAVLINLGIAYAQGGDEAKARAAFEQALACHEVVELDTADGSATDSRRLARKAIRMLERGEFRSVAPRSEQLTYRD